MKITKTVLSLLIMAGIMAMSYNTKGALFTTLGLIALESLLITEIWER